jgi:hypothetical protein
MPVVLSDDGLFKAYKRSPLASSASRSSDTAHQLGSLYWKA